jgi:polysaccharide pyruvyl transferase WcaK-like protein
MGMPRRRTAAGPAAGPLRTVVLIGAYGGDHVGDAAILGGVLLTLATRHGVTQATIMSHRPEHTRRLAAGLSTPVTTRVERYTPARVDRLLDQADALVIAGGPVCEMPRVLAKHLAAVHAARIRGLPLHVERVGIGEFRGALSAWAARRVLTRAQTISLRFADAARHPLVAGLPVTVGRDPAFDYLATRGSLDRLAEHERRSVDALFAGVAPNALCLGVNLRPVLEQWHAQGRGLLDRFVERLAQGMADFARSVPRPVVFFAFPMNAIQFGMSDLATAYRLHRALGARVDLRVWEADPQVDGVLYFLRRLDAVVAMRLHAAIFAMSQNVPVLGIDYFQGMDRKLTLLFDDVDRGRDVCSMDAFDPAWMVARLRETLGLDGAHASGERAPQRTRA